MPVANLYATVEDLSQRAPAIFGQTVGEITDEQRASAESLLEAISRAIDSKTRRHAGAFSPSPDTATALVVYGNNKSCLEIPAHIKGTVNTTVTTIAGVAAPHCVEHRGLLCIVDSLGVMLRNARWREGVPYTIQARWGYDSTPADIREACLLEAARRARLNSGDIAGMVTTITRDGSTLQRDDFPPAFNNLIAPYILPERENEDDQAGIVETGDIRSSDDHPYDPFKRYW
jgi:hypothetical protein